MVRSRKTRTMDNKTAFRDDDNGWSGIGYKRNADQNAQNGGTPGHPDSAHSRHTQTRYGRSEFGHR